MKKLILTITLGTAMSCSVFAQGSFIFSTSGHNEYDDWTTPGTGLANNLDDFALFIEANDATGLTPAVVTAAGGAVGINATALPGGLSVAQAWTDILGDTTFILATNSSTATGVYGGPTTGAGGISYLSGATFLVTNTISGGGTVSLYIVGWDAADGATPAIAAGNGSPVGWSGAFNYSYAAGPNPGPPGTPGNDQGLVTPFGVAISPTPEPGTMALAGLGGISMLLFRRRNKA
jgi:hypothetical protein